MRFPVWMVLSITDIGDISGRIDMLVNGRAGWLVTGVRYEEPAEFSFVYVEVVCLVEHPQKAFNMKNLGRILCIMFLLFPVVFSTVLLAFNRNLLE